MATLKNIGWGLSLGLICAVVYSVVAMVLFLVGGGHAFDANGVTLPEVIGMYFFGGIAAGFVIGLLRPLSRWKWGAIFVGIVAAFPVFFGVTYGLEGPLRNWDEGARAGVVVLPILFGSLLGHWFWERANRQPDETE